MRKLFLTWLKLVSALIKKIFKSLYGTQDTWNKVHKVHYVIDANAFNYLKEKCAKEGIPVSEVLLNAMKQGYEIDLRLKPEILRIFQKEGIIPVILI